MSVVHVEVTQDDIDHGKPREPWRCPVALAFARALPAASPSVGAWNVDLGPDGRRLRLDLPPKVSNFIEHYDMQCTVGPFAFDLDVPAELANPTEAKP